MKKINLITECPLTGQMTQKRLCVNCEFARRVRVELVPECFTNCRYRGHIPRDKKRIQDKQCRRCIYVGAGEDERPTRMMVAECGY